MIHDDESSMQNAGFPIQDQNAGCKIHNAGLRYE